MTDFNIRDYMREKQGLVDKTLDGILPEEQTFPPGLHQAMRYCVFAGGKRLRPILALAAAEALGADSRPIAEPACSLELLHTYTLIHDDLPAMDDDDFRRGKPTTHKVYGEAMAILAGDALQAEAFKLLASGKHAPDKAIAALQYLADAASSLGVIGGQAVDIESEGRQINKELLEYIHIHKTGRLIRASVMLGAVLGNGNDEQLKQLEEYSNAIGLVFQITDDILDVEGATETLGKPVGSDEARGKATYPAILGMDEAKRMQQVLYQQALDALQTFDRKAAPLREIARLIIERNK